MRSITTKVISAFPGCGKTYAFKVRNDSTTFDHISCMDSDSSEFNWIKDENGNNTPERNPEFPQNYINHIKENIGKYEVIFVSSHSKVRQALKENNINYTLVYPDEDMKDEFIERYRQRGNNETFIKFISNNWEEFIREMDIETFPSKYILHKEYNCYLNDILPYIIIPDNNGVNDN